MAGRREGLEGGNDKETLARTLGGEEGRQGGEGWQAVDLSLIVP